MRAGIVFGALNVRRRTQLTAARQVSVMTSAAPAIPSQSNRRLFVDLNERASREAA
jgi:hypothetical protein